MTDTIDGPALITFADIKAALELREVPHRQPSKAKRLIMNCVVCGGTSCVTVASKVNYVALRCDNECADRDILDALHVDGILRAIPPSDDLTAKHGNQVRLAYMFAEDNNGKLIHVHGIGWLYTDGKRWVEDQGDKHTRDLVLRTLRRALTESQHDPDLRKAVTRCESAPGITGVLHIASAMPEFRRAADELDADPYLLNCANGTLDLTTFDLRPHNPDDLLTKITEASFDETASGKAWDAFLAEVLPNEAVRECLRRVVGMSLIGRQESHKLPLLTGTGANGKSTAVDAILYALGSYAMTADPNLLTEGKTSSVGQVDLMGKRLAVVSETDKGARMAEATAKQLTGGDRIKARRLYQPFVEFTPSHTLVMVTNHPPRVSGDDEAMWRRLMIFPFDVVIPEDRRDAELPDRLKLEADAVLVWAVQGLTDYRQDGLNPPDEVLGATADYRAKSDHVGRFIAERCVTSTPMLKVVAAQLWDEWQRWAAAEGCDPIGRNSFTEAVVKRKGITTTRSNGKRWLEGIALTNGTDDD